MPAPCAHGKGGCRTGEGPQGKLEPALQSSGLWLGGDPPGHSQLAWFASPNRRGPFSRLGPAFICSW